MSTKVGCGVCGALRGIFYPVPHSFLYLSNFSRVAVVKIPLIPLIPRRGHFGGWGNECSSETRPTRAAAGSQGRGADAWSQHDDMLCWNSDVPADCGAAPGAYARGLYLQVLSPTARSGLTKARTRLRHAKSTQGPQGHRLQTI